MTECSACGAELAAHQVRCPICGKPTVYYHRQRRCLHCASKQHQGSNGEKSHGGLSWDNGRRVRSFRRRLSASPRDHNIWGGAASWGASTHSQIWPSAAADPLPCSTRLPPWTQMPFNNALPLEIAGPYPAFLPWCRPARGIILRRRPRVVPPSWWGSPEAAAPERARSLGRC